MSFQIEKYSASQLSKMDIKNLKDKSCRATK